MFQTTNFYIKCVEKTSKTGNTYKACVLYNDYIEYIIGFEKDYNIIKAIYTKNLKKGDKE